MTKEAKRAALEQAARFGFRLADERRPEAGWAPIKFPPDHAERHRPHLPGRRF